MFASPPLATALVLHHPGTSVIAVRGNLVSTAEVRGKKGTKAFFLFELP